MTIDKKALALKYDAAWAEMKIYPNRIGAAKVVAKKILANKDRYLTAQAATGVPWSMIGLIEARESGCNQNCHLHNGDPLTAKTYHEPAGRPKAGAAPYDWLTSAIDALTLKGYNKRTFNTIGDIAVAMEEYNGFGYYRRGIPSPYLWAGSDQYVKGKFIRDKVFDPNHVDEQTGAMVVLKALAQLDASVDPTATIPSAPIAAPIVVADPLPPPPKATQARQSKTVKSTIGGALLLKAGIVWQALASGFDWLFQDFPTIKAEADTQLGVLDSVAKTCRFEWGTVAGWLGVALLIVAISRHLQLKAWLFSGGVEPGAIEPQPKKG